MDTAAMYAGTRGRITELVQGLTADELLAVVPATPEWRVRDITSHLSGVVADVLAGNLEGIATDAWTGAQVDARRDKSVDEILAEWSANAPALEDVINSFGPAGVQAVMDTVTHEHDIRGAVNRAGARDSEAADASLQWLVNSAGERLEAAGIAVRIVAGSQEWVVGAGEAAASVVAPSEFDLLRALIGRRSITQVANWKWEGDPGPYFGLLSPWGLRASDLVE
jgi:uncharacterized protein (TIGR03083 family)